MCSKIRRGDYDELVSLTLGPEKHDPIYEKIASPVNEVALLRDEGYDKEETSTFKVMQKKSDNNRFISNGLCKTPILNGRVKETELALLPINCEDKEGQECKALICLDSTKEFLSVLNEQHEPSKFKEKCEYKITGPPLEVLLSIDGEFLGEEQLKVLNIQFQCYKIVKGQSSPVYFKQMNSTRKMEGFLLGYSLMIFV